MLIQQRRPFGDDGDGDGTSSDATATNNVSSVGQAYNQCVPLWQQEGAQAVAPDHTNCLTFLSYANTPGALQGLSPFDAPEHTMLDTMGWLLQFDPNVNNSGKTDVAGVGTQSPAYNLITMMRDSAWIDPDSVLAYFHAALAVWPASAPRLMQDNYVLSNWIQGVAENVNSSTPANLVAAVVVDLGSISAWATSTGTAQTELVNGPVNIPELAAAALTRIAPYNTTPQILTAGGTYTGQLAPWAQPGGAVKPGSVGVDPTGIQTPTGKIIPWGTIAVGVGLVGLGVAGFVLWKRKHAVMVQAAPAQPALSTLTSRSRSPKMLGMTGDQKTLLNSLSESARETLKRMYRDGGWTAAGSSVHAGRVERTSASTLRALERKGLVITQLSSDGGMAARLTELGNEVCKARAEL